MLFKVNAFRFSLLNGGHELSSLALNVSSSQISVFSSDCDVSSSQGDIGSSKVVIVECGYLRGLGRAFIVHKTGTLNTVQYIGLQITSLPPPLPPPFPGGQVSFVDF